MPRPSTRCRFALLARAVLLAAGGLGLGGCAELSEVKFRPLTGDSTLDQPTIEELADLRYPEGDARGPDLDVVVVPGRTQVSLVNRTPRAYRDVRLWLNEQYVAPGVDVPIGERTSVDLRAFTNALEEPFPIGTLLEPTAGRPVVSMEMHDPSLGVRYRLTVQHNDDDAAPSLLR